MLEVLMTAANISIEDLSNFHACHFSTTAVGYFAKHFLGPVEEEEYTEEVEDDLGYYENGAKRTLTDEQIAIFRHSEIQALLKERRYAEEAKGDPCESPTSDAVDAMMDESQHGSPAVKHVDTMLEDGELQVEEGELDDDPSNTEITVQPVEDQNIDKGKRKKNKNRKKRERPPQPKGFFKQNVKPDLRKRTWDKVDAGLGNLDYDEGNSAASSSAYATQRRRISYDDD